MVDEPPEHQPEFAEPNASPDVFEYSESAKPGSKERLHLEAQVAELGWSHLFELLPPGVAEAYTVISEDLHELALQLVTPALDDDSTLRSLGTYIRTIHRLDQYREEFGLWWGLPHSGRAQLNVLLSELRVESPLTSDQIQRLKERWDETEDESVTEFLDLVEADDVASLQADGSLAVSDISGPRCLQAWVNYCTAPNTETATPARLAQLAIAATLSLALALSRNDTTPET